MGNWLAADAVPRKWMGDNTITWKRTALFGDEAIFGRERTEGENRDGVFGG